MYTSCEAKIPIQIETIEPIYYSKEEHNSGLNITTPSKKCEDETNIEDLELEISVESIETSIKIENEVINVSSLESSISESNIVNEVTEDHLRTLSPSPTTEDNSVELSIEDKKQTDSRDPVEAPNFEIAVSTEPNATANTETKHVLCNVIMTEHKEETINDDDDFGDFDDFQFTSTDNNPIINTCNPWDCNKIENDDFGNFTANFEAVQEVNMISDLVTEPTQAGAQSDVLHNVSVDGEDDFGDFDDFKSSAIIGSNTKYVTEDTLSSHQGPGINFHLSDNESQLMESITNILGSIFEEEITEPDVEFEGKLESMLSETWRHLRETDVRQPYIVNWNNSLGQKTLLKALCIDSRNIVSYLVHNYDLST